MDSETRMERPLAWAFHSERYIGMIIALEIVKGNTFS
jgi:hypothetical protein